MFPFFKISHGMVRRKAYIFCLLAFMMLFLGAAAATADPLDNWTSRTSGISNMLNEVTFGNNTFVAVGYEGTILTSPDGVNWTGRTSGTVYDLWGVTYGNNTFVAVGGNGTILTSPDGVNWVSRTSGTSKGLNRVTYNNTFVAVGENGTILTSPDGVNWTGRTSGTVNDLWGVACGSGTFVVVGGNGTILTSPDGANWVSRTSGTSQGLYGATYSNNTFVAVGYEGTILQSDGITTGVTGTITTPGASSALQLTAAASGTGIVLNWSPPSDTPGLTGYYIYRGTSPGGESALPLRDFPVTQTTYTDTPGSSGTYYYIVKPVYNNTTPGEPSNEASATIVGITIVLQVGQPTMTVNGVSQEIDPGQGTAPVLADGRVFVPIRSIVEAMGGTIGWTAAEQKVTINLGSTVIDLWIGQYTARVNGVSKTLDVAPYVSSTGRTMLPLRFVTENLGSQVQWDGANQRITITSGGVSQKPPTTTQPPATSTPAAAAVDFTGAWDMTVNGEAGHKLVLTQNGSSVTGYAGYDQESGHAFSGTVSGSTLSGKFHTNNPVTEWEFTVTMAADGNSFDGLEYYSDTPWPVHGVKAGAVSPQVIDFSGVWKLNVNGEDMGNDYCLVLQQNGSSVTGYAGYDQESGHAFSGTVSGSNLNGKFYTTNPVSEWEFKVTVDASGNSFEGTEYYSNPPWAVYGVRK